MEKFESQQYRDDLAKEIKNEPDKEKRKKILAEVQEMEEYKISKKHKEDIGDTQENKDEKISIEALPDSWEEYFDQTPEHIQDFMDKALENGIETVEVDRFLNHIVFVSKDLMEKVIKLKSEYENIVDFEQKKFLDDTQKEAEKEAADIDENLTRRRGLYVFEMSRMMEEQLSYIKPFLVSSKSEAKELMHEFIKKSTTDPYDSMPKSESEEMYWEDGKEMLIRFDSLRKGSYWRTLNDSELTEKIPNIVYTAPKSGLFPAQIFKGGCEYLSNYHDTKEPFFTFPNSKEFTSMGNTHPSDDKEFQERHNERKNKLEELLAIYLSAQTDEEKEGLRKNIDDAFYDYYLEGYESNQKTRRKTRDEYNDYAKNLISTVVSLNNSVENFVKKNKEKKEIKIMFLDDAISAGRTISGMETITDIVRSSIEKKYSVIINKTTKLTYFSDSSYVAFPSHFKQSGGWDDINRISYKESPVNHKTIRFFYDLARISGYQMQAEVDIMGMYWKIDQRKNSYYDAELEGR